MIAIIGILIGLLLPAVQSARQAANHDAARWSLMRVGEAQAVFRDQDRDRDGRLQYASSLRELAAAVPELVDDDLADGAEQGYDLRVDSASEHGWVASADPAVLGVTGTSSYVTDQDGVVRERECRAGLVWDRQHQACVPLDPDATVEDRTVATLEALDRIAFGLGLEPATALVRDDARVADVARQVDADGDGLLTFQEVLEADPFTLARRTVGAPQDAREEIAGEDRARRAWDEHRHWLEGHLRLGAADEDVLPQVAVPRDDGAAAALLARATPVGARASLQHLLEHVLELDPATGPRGDMTHEARGVNENRQQTLARDVERMLRLHDKGLRKGLPGQLGAVRARADGDDRSAADWVTGPRADRIVMQVDLTLRMLADGR